jgi:hypothetical protein
MGSAFNIGFGWHPLREWAVGLEFGHMGDDQGCHYYDCGTGFDHLDVDVLRLSAVVEHHVPDSRWRWRLAAGAADLCLGSFLYQGRCEWQGTLMIGAYTTYHWPMSARSKWSAGLRLGVEAARFKPLSATSDVSTVNQTGVALTIQLRRN